MNGMLLVLDGEARYTIDGQTYGVKGGDLVFVPPGSTREATTTGMTCAAFDFVLKRGIFRLPPVSRYTRTEELNRLIREFQYEWLQKAAGRDMKCTALFLLILHSLLYGNEAENTNYHVEKLKRHIVDHFAEPVRVGELAGLVGLSPVYCGALFRKTQGVTIAEYAKRIRVHKATALLDEGVHGITEIAYMCGFNDVYYFSRTFKRIMGVSPTKYKTRPSATAVDRARQLRLLMD